jgi:Lipocalin-like domain
MTGFRLPIIAPRVIALTLGFIFSPLSHAQAHSHQASVVGTWHFVHIDSPGSDGKPSDAAQPTGMLIYTTDGHAAVQLMYPQTSLSNEFVHDGYEATFGTYDVDKKKREVTYRVRASATREKLVGKSETLHYEFPDARHMLIRPTNPDQHWSVLWERY